MRYVTGTTDFQSERPTAVTLGKFDGLHRGHRLLVQEVMKRRAQGMETVLFTFDRSPQEVFSGTQPKVLMTNEERREAAEACGFDMLVECPFVPSVYRLSPDVFVSRFLIGQLHMRYMAVGMDFRFGRNAEGNAAFLQQAGGRYGFAIDVVDVETWHGQKIGSTEIRSLICAGRMEEAAENLGYPYFLRGFSDPDNTGSAERLFHLRSDRKLLPPDGLYPVEVTDSGGRKYDATLRITGSVPDPAPQTARLFLTVSGNVPLACGLLTIAMPGHALTVEHD